MTNYQKLTFMVKTFGLDLALEFINEESDIDKAFKKSLYAQYVLDNWWAQRYIEVYVYENSR